MTLRLISISSARYQIKPLGMIYGTTLNRVPRLTPDLRLFGERKVVVYELVNATSEFAASHVEWNKEILV